MLTTPHGINSDVLKPALLAFVITSARVWKATQVNGRYNKLKGVHIYESKHMAQNTEKNTQKIT